MRLRRLFASREQFRNLDRGSVAVMVAASFLPLSMATAVVADGGRVWVEKQSLQSEVEAAALSVAQEWARGGVSCDQGSLDLINMVPSENVSCSVSPLSNGALASVSASGDVSLQFAQLFGRDTARLDASTTVRVGPVGTVSGLRPVAMCAANPGLTQWLSTGGSSTATYTINVNSSNTQCGTTVSGNWAILDFDGGSNSMSDAQNWIANGFQGEIAAGQTIDGDPGIPTPALNLDDQVGRTIVLPVFVNPRLEGSNAMYDVVGFVQVWVVAVNLAGSASQRNVKVIFERGAVTGVPSGPDSPDFGLSSWAVCSFDGKGVCS
jgi:hypothetical protein